MSSESLLVVLFVGLVAGWLAGQFVQGTGFGLIGDLVIGLLGALIGSWLLIYVVILREISLVILLYNPSTIVLSVGLMDVWGSGFYPELAVYSAADGARPGAGGAAVEICEVQC